MAYFADLHIHSCLSPCGDDDMTPCNIAGMAKIKGLDIIAVCDHNTARNLPAVQRVCEAYGLLLLPGMEITTKEEVHLLGYFPTVDIALEFGEMLRARTRLVRAASRSEQSSPSVASPPSPASGASKTRALPCPKSTSKSSSSRFSNMSVRFIKRYP